jgi:hypothetical protein
MGWMFNLRCKPVADYDSDHSILGNKPADGRINAKEIFIALHPSTPMDEKKDWGVLWVGWQKEI